MSEAEFIVTVICLTLIILAYMGKDKPSKKK